MKRQANGPYTWKAILSAIVAVSMALTVTTTYADKSDGAKRMPLTNQYYYLTIEEYQGDLATVFLPDCDAGVDCACADGYHMASFGELFFGTGLVYQTELGLTTQDSGYGPPTFEQGWVRSGSDGHSFNNCSTDPELPWISNSHSHRGIKAMVDPRTDLSGTSGSGWVSGYYSTYCDEWRHVWCIED